MSALYPVRLLQDHAFALIDRVGAGDIPSDWPLIPLVPQGLENEAHLLPALLPCTHLTDSQQMQLIESLEHAHRDHSPPTVMTFVDSSADLEKIRAHWLRQLVIRLPQGGRALLRSYDPRVFVQLQWMLRPAQTKQLFGPITRWTTYLGRGWYSAAPPNVMAEDEAATQLNAAQTNQLARIGNINQVLDKLPLALKQQHETTSRCIDNLLQRAQEHGLQREDEQISFAIHGMTIHPDFDRHPTINRLITTLDREEQTYCDAVAMLDAAAWQNIANELHTLKNGTTI
jgi:hypothetical protein